MWQRSLPPPDTRHSAKGCFVGYEKNDVLWQGRKIAGAAQRRNKLGLLIQGSVQPPPPSPARVDWQKAFCDVASFKVDVNLILFVPDSELRERVKRLAAQKYSQPAYNRKR